MHSNDESTTLATKIKLALVIALTAVMVGLVLAHMPGVNGPDYWRWSWRRLAWWPLYAMTAAAAIPFFTGQILFARTNRAIVGLLFVALSTLLLQLASMAAQPPTQLRRMIDIIESANINYYADAKILAAQDNVAAHEWLSAYPQVLPMMHMHAKYKPAGLVLFNYTLIQMFGRDHISAAIAGVLMALFAAAAGPATYAMLKFMGRERAPAFCGASFMAMCPSLILFWPQFDQVYVTVAAATIGLWAAALDARKTRTGLLFAIAFGAVLWLASFASYTLLTLGVALSLQAILHLGLTRGRDLAWLLALSATALATVAGLYVVFWAATGFDPIATYHQITRSLANDMVGLARPFPRHILYDLLDYLLGIGWIGGLLALFAMVTMRGRIARIFTQNPYERLTFLALAQLLVVAFTALLPGETARTWMPYMPLMMAPIGFELAKWPSKARLVTFACLWLIVVVIGQNMTFLYMGPALDGPR
jgi:hypothetical protein